MERLNDGGSSPPGPGVKTFLGIVLALVLYVLSIGPVGLFCEGAGIGNDVLRKVYLPVIWLHDYTPLQFPLEAYLRLFGLK
jgi:hypothetical protein